MRAARKTRRLSPVATTVLCACLCAAAPGAEAQPAPSFLATCETLRASLSQLGATGERLVTISVQDTITLAERDEALAYLAVCSEPHPRVLCVTYELSGRAVGDMARVTGALNVVDEDHIMLDPCLASPPEPGP